MKAKLLTAALFCFTSCVFIQYAAAQTANTLSSNYIAYNSKPSESNSAFASAKTNSESKTAAGSATFAAAYRASEQYVFNNLSSIKKFFSVPDIYFDLDDAAIRPDAEPVLDYIVTLMKEHPEIRVAATAHCDSRNSDYNQGLAIRRAQAANAYLVSKGISAQRILLEKRGRPSVPNPCTNNPACTLAEQQLNRRTEFNIIVNGINLAYVSSFTD